MNDYKREKDACVSVNIYVKCEKNNGHGKENFEKQEHHNNDSCVNVNIFSKCEGKGEHKEDRYDNKNTCVEVNIHAECDEKKKKSCECGYDMQLIN